MDLLLKVTDIRDLTSEIKQFTFVDEGGGELPAFEAGAHIDVHTGNDLWRSYSLANSPDETARYITGILREEGGSGGSRWMHDELSVGDVMEARGPLNDFPLVESAESHLLIAGGIGITPMLAMGYRLESIGADFHLHYCTKTPEGTAFMDDVKEVFGGNLTFHHDGGNPADGIRLDDVLKDQPEGAHVYICGPGGLLNAAREAASHWPDGSVHFELFSSAASGGAAPVHEEGDQPFEVELKSSGQVFTIPADRTILEVLRDEGVDTVYVCEEGWCGTCETGLVSGKVDHRDECLTDDEKATNTKMQICISRALPGERLVLDL